MKYAIREFLNQAAAALVQSGQVPPECVPNPIAVERSRREGYGDFASAAALAMARGAKMKPRRLAELLQQNLPATALVEKTEIAGPGFINFFLADHAYSAVVPEILEKGSRFGTVEHDGSKRVLIEFVSANPTGPLHVGHGRGAAYGDALAKIMRAAGHAVDTEYYVNDIGRQMNILSASVWVRYLQGEGRDLEFPQGAYQGDYVRDVAKLARSEFSVSLVRESIGLTQELPEDVDQALDALIERCIDRLGAQRFDGLREWVLEKMQAGLRSELEDFGIGFDRWFQESSVVRSGEVEQAVESLRKNGQLYESEGAVWLRSSDFGDEKDRVVIRSNGALTYFATDIAYHLNKFRRGYNEMINIWGADHHGYIARMKAALEAAGEDSDRLAILVVQFASLYRKGVKVQMSTRAGEFVTLRQLMDEIGRDAARFFYASRKSDQHLEFDLELAKSASSDNPVYYIQYAHARICSIFRQLEERSIPKGSAPDHAILVRESEVDLMKCLSRFPEVIESSASALEPHQIAYYLRELATALHSFYNKERVLECDRELRDARCDLLAATQQVLAGGLALIGVSVPQTM